MKMPEKKTEFGCSIRRISIEKFKATVDAFIRKVQLAKPIGD
jgi:hypothetical protein